MATPAHSPLRSSLFKESSSFPGSCPSSLCFSPSSDQRFWSNLRRCVDTLLENRKLSDESSLVETNCEAVDRTKRLKEDSLLLIRGFDSVAQTLSRLSSSLDNALQGDQNLAKPPTIRELAEAGESLAVDALSNDENRGGENQAQSKGTKRKFDSEENNENQEESIRGKPEQIDRFKKVKNLAISMAANAATLARELKSIKSNVSFEQGRCALLEEENNNLRHGVLSEKAISPEEDDLVRLQLEALMAEKSRLAKENANLIVENRCLHQLVEYHQLTTQEVSASHENLVRGLRLDFDSPARTNFECFDDQDEMTFSKQDLQLPIL